MPSNGHIKFIDGIRALAIFLVLFFHIFPNNFTGGYIGVDIFFVISGYLITRVISNQIKTTQFGFKNFLFNRITRLLPALLVTLIFSIIFGWIILLPLEYKELNKQLISSGFFASNFLFIFESGYFDPASSKKVFLHLWSLGVEAQFYILWPILYIKSKKLKISSSILACALIILSFTLNLLLNKHPDINFYNPISRLWEFLIGSLLFFHYPTEIFSRKSKLPLAIVKITLPWIGLFSIFVIAVYLKPKVNFSGWLAGISVLGTALIMAGGNNHWLNQKIFSNCLIVWIGKISYPLYLWHWIIFYFANRVHNENLSLDVKLLIILVSLFAAWLTHVCIENPIQARKNSSQIFKSLISLLGITILASSFFYLKNGLPIRVEKQFAELELSSTDWNHPGNLNKATFESQDFYFKNTGSQHTTLFIGDSSIEQYSPRISELIKTQQNDVNNVVFFTKGACSPIPFVNANFGKTACNLPLVALQYLKQNSTVDTVVVGGAWPIYLTDKYNYQYKEKNESQFITVGSSGYRSALLSLSLQLQEIAKTKVKVYLMLFIPFGERFDPYALIDRNLGRYPDVFQITATSFDVDDIQAQLNYSIVQRDLISIANSIGIEIIDPFIYLCKAGQCATLTDDKEAIYKDPGHLSANFASKHANYIDRTVLLKIR